MTLRIPVLGGGLPLASSKEGSRGKNASLHENLFTVAIVTPVGTRDCIGPELEWISCGVEESDPKTGDNFCRINGMSTGKFVVTTPIKVSRAAQ